MSPKPIYSSPGIPAPSHVALVQAVMVVVCPVLHKRFDGKNNRERNVGSPANTAVVVPCPQHMCRLVPGLIC